jgi:transposase InsO family protein
VTVTNQQVQLMNKEIEKGGDLKRAAAKAGMCRQTAAKYHQSKTLPSEMKEPRTWLTRENPFREVWDDVVVLLKRSQHICAKTIFDDLNERYDNRFNEGQLRTLQRQIRRWRALHDDDDNYEVFFPQVHRAGEAAQTDFTHIAELNLTIGGEVFAPLLCHTVLPFSRWEWATRCQSESFDALRRGIWAAVSQLNKVPDWHQTDNSTSATHRVGGKRGFNEAYLQLMEEIGMKARVIAVGEKEQNGSVEALNGALKRFLEQQLLLRNNRDFASEEEFDYWLEACLGKVNGKRKERFEDELQAMRPLTAVQSVAVKEYTVTVSSYATINFRTNIYSVPPRFIGHRLNLRVYENDIDVFFADQHIQRMALLHGRSKHDVNYRHMIPSLIRKPGAFARYRYRESMFPSLNFKRAYEALHDVDGGIGGDVAYLRILYLAATTMQSEVEAALELFLSEGRLPRPEAIKELVVLEKPEIPDFKALVVDLKAYDVLLEVA